MEVDFNNIGAKIKTNSLKHIGTGSGRLVYDLGNGYVIKAAKNDKGIAQNQAEYFIFTNDTTDLFAKITHVSEDFNYIIMEKVEKPKTFSHILKHFNVRNNSELYKIKDFQLILSKHHLNIADIRRLSSWGFVNGRPVIIDYGLTKEVFKKYYLKRKLSSLIFLFL